MQGQELLKTAVQALKAAHGELGPEAALCLLYMMSGDGMTVGVIAAATGFTEPVAYRHISELQKAGLVMFKNPGDGSNEVWFTEAGHALVAAVNQSLSGA